MKAGLIKVLDPEEEKLITEAATLETKLALLEAFELKLLESVRNAQNARAGYATQTHVAYFSGPTPEFGSSAGRQAYPSAY